MTSVLNRIKLIDFPEDQYFREETPKKQIYLHHTAGSSNPFAVMEYWARSEEKVATSFVIGGKPPKGVTQFTDGQIVQAFSSKYWGYHLGVKQTSVPAGAANTYTVQKQSIGIELCNWGYLIKRRDGTFANYVGGVMQPEEVIDLGKFYRGYRFWHNYTDAQIQSLKELLQFLGPKYNIPLTYKGPEMFELDVRAFKGEPGVFSHTSCRKDKFDVYPHPGLISMLQSL